MASIYAKRGHLYCRLKGYKKPGKWGSKRTPFRVGDEAKARRYAKEAQSVIDRRKTGDAPITGSTFRAYIARWLEKRQQTGHDWKQDKGRLEKHVLPVLGDRELDAVLTVHIADLVRSLRFEKELAARTVRNVYSVVAAAMRDAAVDGLITASPCILTAAQLGTVVDSDPEWRSGAVFTREEAETMISDPRIPLDRRLYYAFGLLAGLRPGEIAALRWRHYNPDEQPLGRLAIATAYNTKRSLLKRTKTKVSKTIPVHPTLAAMLAEWRKRGWSAMTKRALGAEDLILPLPPETIARQTKRAGLEPYRGYDYAGKRWREVDLEMLGWRDRALYDTKATFITLAIDDGASPAILRDRVTHTKQQRNAFDGYDRGPHWRETCAEVAKLRLATTLATTDEDTNDGADLSGSGGGFRRPDSDHERPRELSRLVGKPFGAVHARQPSWGPRVARLATKLVAAAKRVDLQDARWIVADLALALPVQERSTG